VEEPVEEPKEDEEFLKVDDELEEEEGTGTVKL
jgi:hypothetical protein